VEKHKLPTGGNTLKIGILIKTSSNGKKGMSFWKNLGVTIG
jgi:hypothetical protein